MIFYIYRLARLPDDIKAAVTDHYRKFGALPDLLRVNRLELQAVEAAVEALKLRVPVTTNGGTLKYEIELGRADD